MIFHHESKESVLAHLGTSIQTGLSSQQVQEKLAQHGENRLREKKKKTNLQRFLDQFKDVMIIILLIAAAISFVIAVVEGNPKEFFEPVLILLIVLLNAMMGVMQESKAEKALDALKSMSAPHARVIRDGKESVIDASQLVPGDMIRLEAGDFIPADARLLRSVSLKSEESALTGESVPSEKDAEAVIKEDAPLGDRSNMVFSGCSITYGTATAVVTATGMDTQMGKIANLLDNEEEGQTPLQEKLAQLGKYLGILEKGDRAITGAQLDAMTDSELDAQVENISVYARVSPENKIRIVKAWQRKGQVVSMTGDGVNDAPALKAADIGCAMGITGTDVAKGAADMTLTDDNFATIVDAVREGRGIYANIKKVVGFLLGTNIGEVITVFMAMILWHKTPLLSMQLLWINLVTDSLPAIALGMEAVESDVMEKNPKPKDEGLFANGYGIQIILQGVMFGLLSLIAFRLGEGMTGLLEGGQTMAFMVLSLSQVVQTFNMRSAHSLFKIGPFSNRKLSGAAALSVALVLLVLFTPLRSIFGLIALPAKGYGLGLLLILTPLLVMEIAKATGIVRKN